MFGQIIDGLFVLILAFLIIKNADGFVQVVTIIASGTSRLVQVLQGNVAAGSGT